MPKVRIDPLNPFPPTFGFTSQQYWGPWEIGGALYLGAMNAGISTVYKSVDNGATWTIPDAANRPSMVFSFQSSSMVWDGATTIHVAYTDTFNTARTTTFSAVTDTFSGVLTPQVTIPAGGPVSFVFLALQSTGNYRLYFLQTDPADANRDHSFISEWNGAVWSAPQQVDINQTGLAEAEGMNLGQGTADVTHLWWQNDAGLRNLYYCPLSAAGVLGPIQTLIAGAGSIIILGHPVIWQGQIVIPYVRRVGLGDDRAAVMIGNPEAVPVWASTDVDPGQPECTNVFASVYNGGNTLRIWYLADDGLNLHQIWYAENTGLGFGVPVLFWDEATDPVIPPPPIQFVHNLSFTLLTGGNWVGFFGLEVASDGGQLCTIFFIREEPPPPVPVTVRIDTGTRRMVILVPNSFDLCLYDDIPLWRKVAIIAGESKCCLPDPRDYFHWEEMTKGASYFRKVGSIATPAPIDGDVLVTSFQVPLGYDGIIRAIFHRYTGPGFVDGSGDIIWRVRVNRAWAKHLGNMLVQIGDITKPSPLEEGIAPQIADGQPGQNRPTTSETMTK